MSGETDELWTIRADMSKETDEILKGCGFLSSLMFGTAALLAVSGLVNGYVIQHMWGWFLTAPYNIPTPSIAQAWGLALMVRYVIPMKAKDPDLSDKDAWETLKTIFEGCWKSLLLMPGFVLVLGYILYHGFAKR